jgi:L,D-transpeptidase ErfK/SrfK
MYSDDAVALYDRVAVGTPVTAVNQPIKVGWLQNELYIEASPTISQVRQWEEHGKFAPAAGDVRRLVLKKAGAAADRIDWATVDRTVRERRVFPRGSRAASPLPCWRARRRPRTKMLRPMW